MKIGFTGTMSVGKTTLVKALSELPEFKDYYIATERSKYLRDLGIPLNTDSTLPGQIIFLAERASEILRKKILTDRTVWDVCSFTLQSKSIEDYQKQTYIDTAMYLRGNYDIVFYISPLGVDVEDNGVRTTDTQYRDKINTTILKLLGTYPPKQLIVLEGSTEDRIKVVLETINKYLYETQKSSNEKK
jgi:deoxyadenosine/deoxycytidine kinase